jgi:hypothetical protein
MAAQKIYSAYCSACRTSFTSDDSQSDADLAKLAHDCAAEN